jgi:hypothetical protein
LQVRFLSSAPRGRTNLQVAEFGRRRAWMALFSPPIAPHSLELCEDRRDTRPDCLRRAGRSPHAPGGTMSYVKGTAADGMPLETLRLLAGLAGLAPLPEDLEPLAISLRDQLASIAAIEALDLEDVGPAVEFDARWEA